MAYGLTSIGWNSKSLAQILADINSAEISAISPTLNVSATSALGQVNGIVANAIAELWNLGQAVYSAYDPSQAGGAQLTSLSLLTSTIRRAPTYSIAKVCTVNVNPGTYLAGTLTASVVGQPTNTFANLQAVVNSGGSAANFTADFQATATGPMAAPAGQLTVMATPVTGWNSITNPTDAVLGLVVESDPALRIRRAQQLQTAGASTAGAIQSDILAALGPTAGGDVLSCSVLFNDTNTTDGNGLPPHSFECIVLGAVGGSTNDTLLAQYILTVKAAGDQAYGSTVVSVNDSQGNPHLIGFSRATGLRSYVDLTVKTNPVTFPSDGVAQIQSLVSAYFATLSVGQTVVVEKIKSLAFGVIGVVDVTVGRVDTVYPTVATANLTTTSLQVAYLGVSTDAHVAVI